MLVADPCSQYQTLVEERTAARQRWRARHPGRNGARAPNFPPELAELQPFCDWLTSTVETEKAGGAEIDPILEAASKFPLRKARKYRSLYAFGYRFRVRSAELHLKTCDSGVAATFVRPCRFGIRDRNPVMAALEYVGYVDEIVELEYGAFKQTVLVGSWVRANYRGSNATVKRDRWGFTIANFNRMLEFGQDSFAFPSQVQQVFYVDCSEAVGWKIVIRTEPRGKRVVGNTVEEESGDLFRHGRDSDFEGLRVQAEEDAVQGVRQDGGRVLRVEEFYGTVEQETAEVYDRDVGESSEEE
ncbi:hypothetical protein M758_UG331700 [Ceratodon purpureus]|nr:hypothetical protein M758_UG331700 [Ceratodon purpureus]